eukprot:gene27604-36406_t
MASFIPALSGSIDTMEVLIREKRGLQAFHIQTPKTTTEQALDAVTSSTLPLPAAPTMVPAFLYYHCSTHNNINTAPPGSSTAASQASKLSLDVRQPPIYSPDGSMLCLVYESSTIPAATGSTAGNSLSVLVVKTSSGENFFTLNRSDATGAPIYDVHKAVFSPKGTYLVTWSRPLPVKASSDGSGAAPPNMHIWHMPTKKLAASYQQKVFKNDSIQWSGDEAYCFRMVTNEVQILTCSFDASVKEDPNFPTESKVFHKGVSQFRVSPVADSSNSIGIAVFEPEHGGKPGRVSLYEYSVSKKEVTGPHSSRTIFGASEAALLWSSLGSSLLIHSHSDVDSSNNSYYGATGLYIMRRGCEESSIVDQSKEGPIHDVKWSPAGDIWAPHGRFLCLAGFGHCSTVFEWSPDSRYFMTATLAPRMNVDNGFKIFKYNGVGPVLQRNLERAFDCCWRQALPGVYPNRGPSPKRNIGTGESGSDGTKTAASAVAATPAVAVAAPYRPPRSSGDTSNFMEREGKGPVGKVVATSSSKDSGGKYQAPGKQRLIPGMAPPSANTTQGKKPAPTSTNNNNNNNNNNANKKAPADAAPPGKGPAPAQKPAVEVDVKLTAAVDKVLAAEEKEKRVKAIKKKLKQLDEIKAKVAENQPIDADQRKKLDNEAALLNELKELS